MFHVKHFLMKGIKMKKFFALFIALTLLLLCGCENVAYEQSEPKVEENEDIYEKLEEKLPELNLGDNSNGEAVAPPRQSFKIVTNDASVFSSSEEKPGVINATVAERNEFLKYKYGADVVAIQKEEAVIADELKRAIESGTEYCDMLSVSAKKTVNLYLSGLLYDMNKLPDFNLDSGFFDKDNSKKLATNNSLYLLADPTNLVYNETYAIFYNRDLIEKAGAESPESLVKRGKWTWDKFLEISKTAARDVYNKTSADLANDVFAYGNYYGEGTYPLVMWASAGKGLVGNTYRTPVELSMTPDEAENQARKLKTYYDTKGRYPKEGDDALKAFRSGRLVFFCNKLDYLYDFRNGGSAESKFGVVPLPKLDESQERYYSLVGNDARVMSVPKTVEKYTDQRKRFVSVVISAICATGESTVCKSYVSAHISLYFTNNDEASAFKAICESITFDFANVFGSSVSQIRLATTAAINDYIDVGSDVSNSINRAKAGFEKYCKDNFK